jgi:hypothetical protein
MEKMFNEKFPYIKWKDLETSDNKMFKHTLTERLFFFNGAWTELKSNISPVQYNKPSFIDNFFKFFCCYEEHSFSLMM